MNYGQNSRNPFETTSNAVGQQPPVQPQQQQQQRGPREYQTTPGDYGYTETITLDEADTNAKPRVQSGEQPDLIEEVLTNKDLLVSKGFYFIFFAAFGSLFPLMGVYFKQLGMNSIQAGILIGIRPIIEFVSAPFWSSMADKFKKGKAMLLASLVCWIIFTWSMSYIRPPAAACVIFNATHHVLYTAYSDETDENYEVSVTERRRGRRSIVYVEEEEGNYAGDGIRLEEVLEPLTARVVPGLLLKRERRSLEQIEDFNPQLSFQRKGSMPVVRTKKSREDEEDDGSYHHKHPPGHITGKSPISIEYTLNYNKDVHATYVSPPFSTVVYKWEEVETVFFLMLLLVLLGEFFSAPAITLADSCTLNYLKDNIDNYGRQRMFGSVGWGISMFFVGMALDNSTEFEWHPCGPHERERNYRTCFSVFVVLMALALLVATRFKFNYEGEEYQEDIQMRPVEVIPGPRPIFNTAPPINPPPGMYQEKKFEFLDKWKSAVFAQRTKELPEWMEVIKHFGSLRYGAFLFATWFMGVGIGLVFTFLFWHLQDLGGTPTLFGMASVVNHISEIIAYMYSLEFIKKFGHTKVLCIGLVCNVVRFLYISWLENPWWVLPFEFIQGVTHATVWAACCSYLTQASPPHLKTSTQGVLQGLHHGLGKGAGAVVGGIFINKYGTPATFAAYGLVSLLILAGFVFMNYRKTSSGFQWFEDEGEHNVVFDEGSGIAPHGVPSAPITKSASKHNITGGTHTGGMDGQSQVNNYSSADGMLAPQSQGGYNGGNWTQYSKQAESNERIDMSLKDKILNYGSISPDLTITDYEKIGDHFRDISEFIYDLQQRDEVSEKDGATPRPELTMFCQQPVTTESGYDW